MARIKNVGDIGRSMTDNESGNYTMKELIELAS